MAIPIQVQLFDAFLGTQEGIHSIILPEIFSSGGSSNLFIDKFGRAKKISGYTKQNASCGRYRYRPQHSALQGVVPL
jgi:hypothetical protein